MRSATVTTVATVDERTPRGKLARSIFDTDNLTALVAGHAGVGWLVNELRERSVRPPSDFERQSLLLHPDTKNVLVRRGVTRTGIETAARALVMVSFAAVVARNRFPDDVREALENGSIGLGEALRPYGMRRHTTTVRFVDEIDKVGGRQVLRVNATLSLPGIGPVALVDEVLYASALRRSSTRSVSRP
ncbi:MAG: hypothetical protein QOF58_3486 [Pseudonocardiales bacterium]|jgi:hypothetical protein|nr:hypothetical protein [Pseudonocardiales bacterium]